VKYQVTLEQVYDRWEWAIATVDPDSGATTVIDDGLDETFEDAADAAFAAYQKKGQPQ